MLLGPPDLARWTKGTRGYHTVPRILEIEAIQRRVARAAGCAFYSQIDAMGGPGSMASWAEEPEPRAQGDRVHLTRTGYTQVGTALATDVLHAYDAWRAEMRPAAHGGEPGTSRAVDSTAPRESSADRTLEARPAASSAAGPGCEARSACRVAADQRVGEHVAEHLGAAGRRVGQVGAAELGPRPVPAAIEPSPPIASNVFQNAAPCAAATRCWMARDRG